MVSICTMKSKIIAIFALIATFAFLGTNSVYAHRYNEDSNNGNDYNNNGNDYTYSPTYNHYGSYGAHFPWHQHRHHHFDEAQANLDTQRPIAINAPTAIDNSGDVKANTDTASKQTCGDKSVCTINNINVIGNGNALALNDNQAGEQDGGSPY